MNLTVYFVLTWTDKFRLRKKHRHFVPRLGIYALINKTLCLRFVAFLLTKNGSANYRFSESRKPSAISEKREKFELGSQTTILRPRQLAHIASTRGESFAVVANSTIRRINGSTHAGWANRKEEGWARKTQIKTKRAPRWNRIKKSSLDIAFLIGFCRSSSLRGSQPAGLSYWIELLNSIFRVLRDLNY